MIREHTIQCDECLTIAPLKDNNMHQVFDDDICRECIDPVLSRLISNNLTTGNKKETKDA